MAIAAERVQELLSGYLDNQLTESEFQELWQLLAQTNEQWLTDILDFHWEKAAHGNNPLPALVWDQKMRERIAKEQQTALPVMPPAGKRFRLSHGQWWAVAASVLLCILAVLFWPDTRRQQPGAAGKTGEQVALGIKPATNKAVLTLADGSAVTLDSTVDGIVAAQGSLEVQQQHGQLTYLHNTTGNEQVLYNALTTPRGGKYRLVLPDGSQVWLNAASSIRYPTAFIGKERMVSLSGEAYFEITPNEKQPFKVVGGGQQVTVLGTAFNINAYTDEQVVKTTLVSGSIKVSEEKPATNTAVILLPGKQAGFAKGDIKVKEVNTDDETAWKNDLFAFNDVDFESIIRELNRWYDVDITVKGRMPGKQLMGNVSRNYNITQILKMLAFTAGIEYEIEGRKIIISPK